jgi:hypothetical protein
VDAAFDIPALAATMTVFSPVIVVCREIARLPTMKAVKAFIVANRKLDRHSQMRTHSRFACITAEQTGTVLPFKGLFPVTIS